VSPDHTSAITPLRYLGDRYLSLRAWIDTTISSRNHRSLPFPTRASMRRANVGRKMAHCCRFVSCDTIEVESEVEQEMEVAKNSHKVVTAAVRDFLDDVRTGKVPQFAAVEDTLTEMEESILRNPDAFMWLRRLKQKDTYTYSHCIDSSVLAIAFARQMGLPRTQI
jgi:HD-GYP domain-containing protein (c-di-GMP phosphodiesterase class II)